MTFFVPPIYTAFLFFHGLGVNGYKTRIFKVKRYEFNNLRFIGTTPYTLTAKNSLSLIYIHLIYHPLNLHTALNKIFDV